jgi:uncharacterized membrane protein
MNENLKKHKNFFIDGLMIILPLFLALYIINGIINFLTEFIKPVLEFIPDDTIFGFRYMKIAGILVFFIIIYLTGLLAGSKIGDYVTNFLSNILIKIIPGYSVFEKFISGGKNYDSDDNVLLVMIDDAWLFGFLIEPRNEYGLTTVFVPSAPLPTSGNVYLVKDENMKKIDIKVRDAVKCLWHLGQGSNKLTNGKVTW